MGRTGRKRSGRIVVLMTEGKEDPGWYVVICSGSMKYFDFVLFVLYVSVLFVYSC